MLKYPYYRDVSEPDIYETATVHTVVGPIESLDSDNTHNPIAVSLIYIASCCCYW